MLYLFKKISGVYYKEFTDKVCTNMLESLQLE